jgi:RecB family endonuclease NucS
VFRNDQGEPVGADYSCGVGDIDLLATDARGGLVVVMVSERGQGEELVAEVLQRVGWVRKHLGEGRRKVRGIVLCEQPPESLSYAASAVADTVSFKTYRVALTFEDLEF